MRITTNQTSTGAGDPVPFDNGEARTYDVHMWGTFSNADLEISPDGGSTWEQALNLTDQGKGTVYLAPHQGYLIRSNLVAGSALTVDVN